MFEPTSGGLLEVTWSDRHGIIERNTALAFS